MPSNRVSASRKALFSVALPLLSFALGILVEALERRESITGWTLWIDNIAAALLLGLVVFFYERRRERSLNFSPREAARDQRNNSASLVLAG
jgi:Na+/melibiose symporter-like transporter